MPNNYEWLNTNAQRSYPLQASTELNTELIDARVYTLPGTSVPVLRSVFSGDAVVVESGGELFTAAEVTPEGYAQLVDSDGRNRGFLLFTPGVLRTERQINVPLAVEATIPLASGLTAISTGGITVSGGVILESGPGIRLSVEDGVITIDAVGRPELSVATRALLELCHSSASPLLVFDGDSLGAGTFDGDGGDIFVCSSKENLPNSDGDTLEDLDPDPCVEVGPDLAGGYDWAPGPITCHLPDVNGSYKLHAADRVRIDPVPDAAEGETRIGQPTLPVQGIRIGLRGISSDY